MGFTRPPTQLMRASPPSTGTVPAPSSNGSSLTSPTSCSFSPFNSTGYCRHGQRKQDGSCPRRGEVLLRSMTRVGNGCLWETFDPRYEAIIASGGTKSPNLPSMCHPWSSGVAHWLTEHHVGIKPAKPGYEAVLLAPYISDLNRAVSGSVGTPEERLP